MTAILFNLNKTCLLLLRLLSAIALVRAQANNNGPKIPRPSAIGIIAATSMPSLAPSSMAPTESPSNSPEQQPPLFLFLRPLNPIHVRLVGAYGSYMRQGLLDSLKVILQEALLDAMVDYYVVDDGGNNSSIRSNSILYQVSLEWTTTNFQADGDPFVHTLEASGMVGLSQYNFVLLHSETILPIQQKVMTMSNNNNNNNNNTTDDSAAISLSQLELALRRTGFFFQIVEFQPVVPKDGQEPTSAPTVLELVMDDEDDEDAVKGPDSSWNNFTDPAVVDPNDTGSSLGHGTDSKDDNMDDNENNKPNLTRSVSNRTIAIVLIVVCTVSTIAFGIFLRYVRFKSNQIKRDRLARSQSLAAKDNDNKGDDKEEEEEEDDQNGNGQTVRTNSTSSSPVAGSMASGTPTTPVSSSSSPKDNGNSRSSSKTSTPPVSEKDETSSSVNLLQRLDAAFRSLVKDHHDSDDESERRYDIEVGPSCKNDDDDSEQDAADQQLEEEEGIEVSTTTMDNGSKGNRNKGNRNKEKSSSIMKQEIAKRIQVASITKQEIAKRIQAASSSMRLPSSFPKKTSRGGNIKTFSGGKGTPPSGGGGGGEKHEDNLVVDDAKSNTVMDLEAGQGHLERKEKKDDSIKDGTDIAHIESSISSPSKYNTIITRIAAVWRLRITFRKDAAASSVQGGGEDDDDPKTTTIMEPKAMSDGGGSKSSMKEKNITEESINDKIDKDSESNTSDKEMLTITEGSFNPKSSSEEEKPWNSGGASTVVEKGDSDTAASVEILPKKEEEEEANHDESKNAIESANEMPSNVGNQQESSNDEGTEKRFEEPGKDESSAYDSANETTSIAEKEE